MLSLFYDRRPRTGDSGGERGQTAHDVQHVDRPWHHRREDTENGDDYAVYMEWEDLEDERKHMGITTHVICSRTHCTTKGATQYPTKDKLIART